MTRQFRILGLAIFCCAGLGLFSLAGCKRKKTPTSPSTAQGKLPTASLLQRIPSDSPGIFVIRQIGELPPRLNDFLDRFSLGDNSNDLRLYVQSWQNRLGFDPLKAKSITDNGFDPKSPLLATRVKLKGRRVALAVLGLSSKARFEKMLRAQLKAQLSIEKFTQKSAGPATVVTAYGQDIDENLTEELSYVLTKDTAMLVIDLGKRKPTKGKMSQWGYQALTQLLKLPRQQSLANDKAFAEAAKSQGSRGLFWIYVGKANKPSSQPTSLPAGTKPQNLLAKMTSQVPYRWSMSTIDLGKQGLKMRSYMALPPALAKTFHKLLPQRKADPKTLFQSLHKDSLLVAKIALEPKELTGLIKKVKDKVGLDLQPGLAFIKQQAGIDVIKDVLAHSTGHAYLSLNWLNKRILQSRYYNPMRYLQDIHLGIVAESHAPKKLGETLAKLKQTLKIANKTVAEGKLKDGSPKYYIPIWHRGPVAQWSQKEKFFIYSLNGRAFQQVQLALANPKQRFTNPRVLQVMAEPHHGVLYIDFANAKKMANNLYMGMLIRMTVAKVMQMLQSVQGILVHGGAEGNGLVVQGEVLLKAKNAAKKRK